MVNIGRHVDLSSESDEHQETVSNVSRTVPDRPPRKRSLRAGWTEPILVAKFSPRALTMLLVTLLVVVVFVAAIWRRRHI
jgi:hypothetical protein